MKKNILYILACIAISLPSAVSASVSWASRQEGRQIFLQGECNKAQIEIDFFSKTEDITPAKTEKVNCQAGQFSYSTDFTKLDIAEGNYIIAVDGEKSQNVVSVTKEKTSTSKKISTEADLVQVDDPDTKFLTAFMAIQQSILDMRTWLSQTSYPTLVKKSLDASLDGLDIAASKISTLILAVASWDASKDDANNDVVVTVENENPDSVVDTSIITTKETSSDKGVNTGEDDNTTSLTESQDNLPILDTTDKTTVIDVEGEGLLMNKE